MRRDVTGRPASSEFHHNPCRYRRHEGQEEETACQCDAQHEDVQSQLHRLFRHGLQKRFGILHGAVLLGEQITPPILLGAALAATGVAIQPDGKILVAGTENIGGNDDFSIMRLNVNGAKDTTFSTDGRAFRTLGGNEVGTYVAVHTDGSIFVIGYTDVGADDNVGLWALRPDGSDDSGFGISGAKYFTIPGNDRAHAGALTSDGRLVAGGFFLCCLGGI